MPAYDRTYRLGSCTALHYNFTDFEVWVMYQLLHEPPKQGNQVLLMVAYPLYKKFIMYGVQSVGDWNICTATHSAPTKIIIFSFIYGLCVCVCVSSCTDCNFKPSFLQFPRFCFTICRTVSLQPHLSALFPVHKAVSVTVHSRSTLKCTLDLKLSSRISWFLSTYGFPHRVTFNPLAPEFSFKFQHTCI